MAEPSYLHPCEMIDDEPQWEVERVLNHRLVKRGRKTEYLLAFVVLRTTRICGRMMWKIVSNL